MRRLGGAVLGLSLLLSVIAGMLPSGTPRANAATTTWRPKPGLTFSVPAPFGSRAEMYRLVMAVEAAIRHTRPTPDDPKPVVMVSSYFLDRRASVDALIGACNRGVSVRVVLDGDVSNPQASRLIRALNADNPTKTNPRPKAHPCNNPDNPLPTEPTALPNTQSLQGLQGAADDPNTPSAQDYRAPLSPEQAGASVDQPMAATPADPIYRWWGNDRSYVVRCKGACRNDTRGNMHAKIFAMSNSGDARYVSMSSSGNLNAGAAQRGFNDMWTVNDNRTLYRFLLDKHLEMTDDRKVADLGWDFWNPPLDLANPADTNIVSEGDYVARLYPATGGGASRDKALVDLDRTQCHGPWGRTQVRVSMFFWADKRGLRLADKLIALGRNGCDVRVVYGAPTKIIRQRLLQGVRSHAIKLWDSRRFWQPRSGEYKVRTHGKWYAIRGSYNGDSTTCMVSQGAGNWVWGSLVLSDEQTLNIENNCGAYDAYANTLFTRIIRASVRVR